MYPPFAATNVFTTKVNAVECMYNQVNTYTSYIHSWCVFLISCLIGIMSFALDVRDLGKNDLLQRFCAATCKVVGRGRWQNRVYCVNKVSGYSLSEIHVPGNNIFFMLE